MTRAHSRYILLEHGAVAVVINVLLNAGIAWAFFGQLPSVPLWGAQSIAGDVVCTCFLLPLIATLIVTAFARADVRRGRFAKLDWEAGRRPFVARLPGSARMRALLLGVITTLLVAPATIGVFAALRVVEMPLSNFILFKGLYCGALAAVIVPFAVYAALHDPPHGKPEAA